VICSITVNLISPNSKKPFRSLSEVIRTDVTSLLLFPVATACLALFSIAILYRSILRESPGTPQMSAIAGYIQEGARAFIKREVRTVAYFIVVLAVLLYVLLGWETSLGFVMGAFKPS
jgi:K(+)-stimulated pyrophosphate-energized sodium pump